MKPAIQLMLAIVLASSLVHAKERQAPRPLRDLLLDDSEFSNDINDKFAYGIANPNSPRSNDVNRISFLNPRSREDILEVESKVESMAENVAPKSEDPRAKAGAGSISLNSREVRLVGPNQKEVEMKDDAGTKMLVALDNLQKEATDVWGQVNKKLDEGWTELKNSDVGKRIDQGWTDLKNGEVISQVGKKLDQGWTDLKSMVEGALAPKKSGYSVMP